MPTYFPQKAYSVKQRITFENEFYKQTFGTAMSTPMAPTVAILFMAWLEDHMLTNSPTPVLEALWKRFIDDIFLLWVGTSEELDVFTNYINSVHPTIKFTEESLTDVTAFLA